MGGPDIHVQASIGHRVHVAAALNIPGSPNLVWKLIFAEVHTLTQDLYPTSSGHRSSLAKLLIQYSPHKPQIPLPSQIPARTINLPPSQQLLHRHLLKRLRSRHDLPNIQEFEIQILCRSQDLNFLGISSRGRGS